jgi:hypothetical protein
MALELKYAAQELTLVRRAKLKTLIEVRPVDTQFQPVKMLILPMYNSILHINTLSLPKIR